MGSCGDFKFFRFALAGLGVCGVCCRGMGALVLNACVDVVCCYGLTFGILLVARFDLF